MAGDRGAKTTGRAGLVYGFFVCFGWVQALDPTRVWQLTEAFRAGDFGVNILKKPSLLEFDQQPKLDAQGARLLCDGKHTVAALKDRCGMCTKLNEIYIY